MPPATEAKLTARTVPGLHEFVARFIEGRFAYTARIADLGCGTGAFVARLATAGYSPIVGADRCRRDYAADLPFAEVDLNEDFTARVLEVAGGEQLDLITAVEVLEHLENPSFFLRECAKLLKVSSGRLLVTSPNVECVPGRLKFLRSGTLRHFDEFGDPTHITPILSGLFERIARNNGYAIETHVTGPRGKTVGSHRLTNWLSASAGPFLAGNRWGDCNLFLLRRA